MSASLFLNLSAARDWIEQHLGIKARQWVAQLGKYGFGRTRSGI